MSPQTPMNVNVTASELDRLIRQGGCCLVDVRQPVEFAEEHLSAARSIPLGELTERAEEVGRNQPVIVMCLGGKRSEEARARLAEMGYPDVKSLEGGLLAWKAAGFPVERSQRKCLPLMQQVQLMIGLGTFVGALLAILANPWFAVIPAFFGAGLIMAGATGWCGLALLMGKMPWNRVTPDPNVCIGSNPKCCR
jgi:rhodanese-related sulfurtransferase